MGSTARRAKPPVLDLGQKSIRVQLALLVLGIVLPAFVVAVVYLERQREAARQIARDKVALLADNAAQRLAGRLRELEQLLTYIANQPFVRAMDPARCDQAIQDIVRMNPEYVGVATRDMRGELVCSYRKEAPTREQMLSYPWFSQSLQQAPLDNDADHAGARRCGSADRSRHLAGRFAPAERISARRCSCKRPGVGHRW